MIPAELPTPLVIPINTPANLGAKSIWLTLYPATARPTHPTPAVKRLKAISLDVPKYPHNSKNRALRVSAIEIKYNSNKRSVA